MLSHSQVLKKFQVIGVVVKRVRSPQFVRLLFGPILKLHPQLIYALSRLGKDCRVVAKPRLNGF